MAQHHEIRYIVTLQGRRLEARTVRGREALSEPSRFRLTVNLPIEDDIDPDDLAGGDVQLHIERHGVDVRTIAFVVMRAERAAAAMAPGVVQTVLELDVTSRLALAEYRVDSRVFRDMDVPDIVTKVLATFGIGVKKHLSSSYQVRPYTVQYNESDFAFVSRLLEDEGIFYTDRGTGDTLVLGDAPSSYDHSGTKLGFVPTSGFFTTESALTDVGYAGSAAPSKVTMRDFDFKKPKLDVVGTAEVPARAAAGGGEWYEYPAGRTDPGGAAQKAQKTAEAFAAAQNRFAGRATELSLAPNMVIRADGLPAGFEDGEFAVVQAEHEWELYRTQFAISFEALEANRTFRPMPRTPRPSLVGGMLGKITGPAGADIHCDEWGRTKVHFPWDRIQPKDDNCSDWIPTLQDNTGSSMGIPRVGWEVIVQHLEGDVDRPVILGRTYNTADTFYSKLPANRMWTTLRSLTSPRSPDGSTGDNLIQINDNAGLEHIYFHAQRDQEVQTENDKTETTLSTDSRIVDGNEAIKVGRTRKISVAKTRNSSVGGDQVVTIGRNRTVKVKGAHTETVTENRKLTIGTKHMRRFDTMDELRVQKNATEKIGALDLEMCPENNESSTRIAEARLVGGAMIEMAKQGIAQTVEKARVEIVGALLFEQAKERIGQRASKNRTTTIGGNYIANAATDILVSGLESLQMTVGELVLSAKEKLTLKVQDTTLILEGERSVIDSPSHITAKADGKNDFSAGQTGQNDRGRGGSK
ncbi:MAG: type VI secretion system tip protein VgrG [Polyangiaceae bacterium]|nr:type VI secretion system tip protein VgrG [Polyangiaceae bacterium]